MTNTAESDVICVLGMHRSGTSLITRLVNLLGFDLGPPEKLMSPNSANPKGYWEYRPFVDINDQVLMRLGGNWHEPPNCQLGWETSAGFADLRRQARALVELDFSKRSWVWKDPRACLTLPFWRHLLPTQRYVICLRNPADVAKSLARRDNVPFAKSINLWHRYTKSSLEHSAECPTLFVFYEDILHEPVEEVRRLANFIGKVPVEGAVFQDFLDRELHHYRTSFLDAVDEPEFAFPAKALYVALRLFVNERRKDTDPAPVLSSEAGQIWRLFSRCSYEAQMEAAELAKREAAVADLKAGLNQKSIEVEQLLQEKQTLAGAVEELRSELQALNAAYTELRADKDRSAQALALKERALDNLRLQAQEREQTLQAQVRAEQERSAKARRQLHEHQQQLADGNEKIAAREELIATLRSELEKKSAACRTLEEASGSMQARVSSLSEQVRAATYENLVGRIRKHLVRILPADAKVIVISKGDSKLLELEGRTGWHFPRAEDGEYAGYYPADSAEAIQQLESLCRNGAQFFVIPNTAFWWFEHYDSFTCYLDTHFPRIWKNEDCQIYQLSKAEWSSMAHSAPGRPMNNGTGDVLAPSRVNLQCSIIIPVYNEASLTRQCLDVLLANREDSVGFEVLVVDDASTDMTSQLLADYGDRIRVVRQTTNRGFAAACNLGAAAASGEYLVFLNNDTVPMSGWLAALVRHAENHPKAGAVGSKLLYPNHTIQHAGMVVCQDRFPRHIYKGFPADHPAVNKSRRFQAVTGACMLILRELFLREGGFDPAFVNSYEDVDLCLRLGERGYEVHYCHESVLCHLESASREVRSEQERRNVELYRSRWAHRAQPDDLRYYVEDGLLTVDYQGLYPLPFILSPLLAVVAQQDREAGTNHLRQTPDIEPRTQGALAESAPEGPVGRESEAELDPKKAAYRRLIQRIREVAGASIPPTAKVLVVSKGDSELLKLDGRTAGHFPQSDEGEYAGHHPANSIGAIVQLEVLRSKGADFLLVPQTSFWWFDFYADFHKYLETRYRLVVRNEDTCAIFALRQIEATCIRTWPRLLEEIVASFQNLFQRDPAILDWNTGVQIGSGFPQLTIFSPRVCDAPLPYLDRSIDLVAIPSSEPTLVAEARRVAAEAVLVFNRSGAGPAVDVEWQPSNQRPVLPRTSIIMPSYNGIAYTETCLRALQETLPGDFQGEIIVVDDGSTDGTWARLQRWTELDNRVKLLRNEINSGFIVTCNRGANAATGDFLVFLNNDTIPLPGWLSPLLRIFRAYGDAGAAGGKLIFPNGRLQEAGSIVFSDGSAANFGRMDFEVNDPLYNYVREVDYCSGALLATPRRLFEELGGFDPLFSPGYYEETDYCFKVREKGCRVYYQPESLIIHLEGGINGSNLSSGTKHYQIINRQKFVDRWSHVLNQQPCPPCQYNRETWYSLAVRGKPNGAGDPRP